MGVSLSWKSASHGLTVRLHQVHVTLVNRDHFSGNMTWCFPSDTVFTPDHHKQGNPQFIKMHDLLKTRGRYVDTNGEFVVALFMAEPQTNFQVTNCQ